MMAHVRDMQLIVDEVVSVLTKDPQGAETFLAGSRRLCLMRG